MFFNLVRREGAVNLTAFIDGDMFVADENHPHITDLIEAAIDGDDAAFIDLHDASHKAAAKFENLSDRVTVANSRVYVDQTEVDDVFADQIIRFMNAGVDDWKPLVLFLEKIYSNTADNIRENLSRWLKSEEFTILPNGNILGYRGLNSNFTSVHAGPGIVNGERVNGHLDNSVGNVVEIDAHLVENNPNVGCASGLHVGTHNYAKGWSRGKLVSVEVDPRHVRSVPYECGDQKMRVSKYKVLEVIQSKDTNLVSNWNDTFLDEYDEWADY